VISSLLHASPASALGLLGLLLLFRNVYDLVGYPQVLDL